MSIRNSPIFIFPVFLWLVLGVLFSGCTQDSGLDPGSVSLTDVSSLASPKIGASAKSPAGFSLEAREASIRSCPTGGGIFVIRLVSDEGFAGMVGLSLKANNRLHAELDKTFLTAEDAIAEITIKPSNSVAIETHIIEVRGNCAGNTVVLPLEVVIVNWSGWGSGTADQELAPFIPWLEAEHAELGDFSERIWTTYPTYPGILVVEHWTYLDADWELRLCYHVMIPPYDWSKILLRRRGEWDPILAAERDTNGDIFEIPIEEY